MSQRRVFVVMLCGRMSQRRVFVVMLCVSAKHTVHGEWGRGEHLSPVSHAEVEG